MCWITVGIAFGVGWLVCKRPDMISGWFSKLKGWLGL